MERKETVYLSAQQKLDLIKDHLLNNVPVSDLCDTNEVAPSVYWEWQRTLFNNGAAVLERKKSRSIENNRIRKAEARVAQLEEKLKQKNFVMAELMQEHMELKKKLNGES